MNSASSNTAAESHTPNMATSSETALESDKVLITVTEAAAQRSVDQRHPR